MLRVGLVDEDDALLCLDSATQFAQAVTRAHVVGAFHTVSGGATEEHDHHVRGIDERLKGANIGEVVHVQEDAQARDERGELRLDGTSLVLTRAPLVTHKAVILPCLQDAWYGG